MNATIVNVARFNELNHARRISVIIIAPIIFASTYLNCISKSRSVLFTSSMLKKQYMQTIAMIIKCHGLIRFLISFPSPSFIIISGESHFLRHRHMTNAIKAITPANKTGFHHVKSSGDPRISPVCENNIYAVIMKYILQNIRCSFPFVVDSFSLNTDIVAPD